MLFLVDLSKKYEQLNIKHVNIDDNQFWTIVKQIRSYLALTWCMRYSEHFILTYDEPFHSYFNIVMLDSRLKVNLSNGEYKKDPNHYLYGAGGNRRDAIHLPHFLLVNTIR